MNPEPLLDTLRDWRENGNLSQTNANKVRKVLCNAVAQWVDWQKILVESATLDHLRIALPKVPIGNPAGNNIMAVAIADKDLEDPLRVDQFFSAMTAVIRFDSRGTWDYEGGETDSASYANLINYMALQAEGWLRRQAHSMPREGIQPLAQALLIGARLLDLDGSSANTDADNLAAIFVTAPADEGVEPPTGDQWSRLQSGSRRFRADARALLLRLIVSRQGSGSEVRAIDPTALLAAIKELRSSWLFQGDFEYFREYPSLKAHLSELKNRLKNAAKERCKALGVWRLEIEEWLGEDFEIHALVDDLKTTALTAYQTSAFRAPGLTYNNLRDSLNKLPDCRLRETLDLAKKVDESGNFGVVLSALAQVNPHCEEDSRRILKDYESFLNATSLAVDEKIATAPPSVVEEAKRRDLEVAAVEKLLQQIKA